MAALGSPLGVGAQTSIVDASPAPDTGSARVVATDLDSLVARALIMNPSIRAAEARLAAARARVGPSGLPPDPMLMVGVQNLPASDPGFADGMTMKMVGIGQTIPYPGKLGLSRRVAERERDAAAAALDGARLKVTREARIAAYELAFLDQALAILGRNREVLIALIQVTETRYGTGAGGQRELLDARIGAGRLAETAVDLTERRRATVARLNALLDRPSDAPVGWPAIPRRVVRAAVVDSASEVRFASSAFGARASDSPLPPVAELQAIALRENPMLRESASLVDARVARAELAARASLPDVDIAVQYGQRTGRSDMLTATVSMPLPIRKGKKQDAEVAAVTADLRAAEADLHARQNDVRAEIARLHAEIERDRAQLALYVRSIVPQGRALLASAMAGLQSGGHEFQAVLERQATLFDYEMEYARLISRFAATLAELEQVVGKEVLP